MAEVEAGKNFVREIMAEDLKTGNRDHIATRFPPEPNGYLHIGHAKSICTNFGLAKEFGGTCNLRFDDTDPVKESTDYCDSIRHDVEWMGFKWANEFYASDYFDQLYAWAQELIRRGLAYVDEQTAEQISENRGNFYRPGVPSPWRDRPAEESLDMLERMKNGEFEEGRCVLRAKIDMAHQNMNMRDPLMYRIKKVSHHRTGDKWCIYPMYDFAHGLSDSIEGITHSVCTLEFEDHRILYDWFIDALGLPHDKHPQQIEFAKLNLTYIVLSKRRLLSLVKEGLVNGWDDPRMPTISGMRRRGFTAEAIRRFCEVIGVNKRDTIVEFAQLEHCVREHLNETVPRVMGVTKPIRVLIENYPEDQVEWFDAPYSPTDASMGTRKVPFSRELYIESADFMEDAPSKFYRLTLGREVRLRYAYVIKCVGVDKDDAGNIIQVRCTYDPETRGGSTPDGRKIKATIHWLSRAHALPAECRMINALFTVPNPLADEDGDFKKYLNPNSMEILQGFVEPALADVKPGYHCQFERVAYFNVDDDSTPDHLIFNRTVTMSDDWAKIVKRNG